MAKVTIMITRQQRAGEGRSVPCKVSRSGTTARSSGDTIPIYETVNRQRNGD